MELQRQRIAEIEAQIEGLRQRLATASGEKNRITARAREGVATKSELAAVGGLDLTITELRPQLPERGDGDGDAVGIFAELAMARGALAHMRTTRGDLLAQLKNARAVVDSGICEKAGAALDAFPVLMAFANAVRLGPDAPLGAVRAAAAERLALPRRIAALEQRLAILGE